ncbi:hypothetical protein ACJ2A9_10980 [Anaerobacillus sp. MEB173]|uniref:hypothetical protein n=1 Tax=Anaerobacillus sp. MEB173 TaxID=3383345 RepID=UPI003F8DFCEE
MLITFCEGKELEKERPNTSEDFFNRSTVKFLLDGQEKEFHLLYIRYFDEIFNSFVPFESDPIFQAGDREVTFKDIVALVCLIKNPTFAERKRIYINDQKEFQQYFQGINYDKIKEIFEALQQRGEYKLDNRLVFQN